MSINVTEFAGCNDGLDGEFAVFGVPDDSIDPRTFDEAKVFCSDLTSENGLQVTLARIGTKREFDFLSDRFDQVSLTDPYWIGLEDPTRPTQNIQNGDSTRFFFVDGVNNNEVRSFIDPGDSPPWFSNEPENDGNCIFQQEIGGADNSWFAQGCGSSLAFLCRRECPVNNSPTISPEVKINVGENNILEFSIVGGASLLGIFTLLVGVAMMRERKKLNEIKLVLEQKI